MSTFRTKKTPPFRLSASELALTLLGVAGFVLFFLVLPGEHPDSTVSREIDAEEAADRARTFLASQGFIMDAAEPGVHLKRDIDVLTGYQRTYGRRGTVRLLDTTRTELPSAYYWSVIYRHRDPEKEEDAAFAELTEMFTVDLTIDGEVFEARNMTDALGSSIVRYGSAHTAVNRTVLATGMASDTSDVRRIRDRLRTVPDSTLRTMVGFDVSDAELIDTSGADARIDRLEANQPVTLYRDDVVRMASLHLNRMAVGGLPLALDSLTVRQRTSNPIATLEYGGEELINGQELKATLELTSTGNLREFAVDVNPDSEPSFEVPASETLKIVRAGGWGMLALVIIVVFFRRMIARVVDVKSAMLDAMLLGLVFGGVSAISVDHFLSTQADIATWLNILFRLVAFSVVGGGAAILAFMVSGVGDSIGREVFPYKMRTLALMRHGDYRNKPVGAVLVRGIAAGGVLLGLIGLIMILSPGLPLDLGQSFASDRYMRPMLASVFSSITTGFLIVLMILVCVGTAAGMIHKGRWMYVAGVASVSAVLQIIPMDFASGWMTVVYSGVFGAALAGLFLRYDAMTAFTAFVTARLLIGLSEGVLVAGSPAGIDLLLGVLFLVTLVVLGIVGVASGRSEKDLQQYVPEYVTEMASQERVKRELELAHQVQASFLPRTMPRVSGIDLAGMCLPANEVGGDYFDFIQLNDRQLAFVVGDVSGKGIHAAFFMTLVKGILQTLSRDVDSPAEVMRKLNHLFCLNAPAGVFISMIYGVVDSTTGEFRFARAGHNPGILCRGDSQSAEFLKPAGMAIGFTDGDRFDTNIEEAVVTLDPGDALVFYTDGFSEAMNKRRELYGDERLATKVGQIGGRSANGILRALTEDVHHFIEGSGRADDMTMVVLKLDRST